jgi:hypothetical protein
LFAISTTELTLEQAAALLPKPESKSPSTNGLTAAALNFKDALNCCNLMSKSAG